MNRIPAAISWLLSHPLAMLGIAVVLAGIGWGVVLLVQHPHALDCPKGQHIGVITYVPITVGKTVIVSPVYGCLEGSS